MLKRNLMMKKQSGSSSMNVGTLGDSSQDTAFLSRKRKSEEKKGDAASASRKVGRTDQVHTTLQ